ncbi:hypothetical protein CLU79DRAFT_843252 [Phycomyces nitens]|nr:hypothetical protein CLU79DRAFT_843252 [Phycomyces nitens]
MPVLLHIPCSAEEPAPFVVIKRETTADGRPPVVLVTGTLIKGKQPMIKDERKDRTKDLIVLDERKLNGNVRPEFSSPAIYPLDLNYGPLVGLFASLSDIPSVQPQQFIPFAGSPAPFQGYQAYPPPAMSPYPMSYSPYLHHGVYHGHQPSPIVPYALMPYLTPQMYHNYGHLGTSTPQPTTPSTPTLASTPSYTRRKPVNPAVVEKAIKSEVKPSAVTQPLPVRSSSIQPSTQPTRSASLQVSSQPYRVARKPIDPSPVPQPRRHVTFSDEPPQEYHYVQYYSDELEEEEEEEEEEEYSDEEYMSNYDVYSSYATDPYYSDRGGYHEEDNEDEEEDYVIRPWSTGIINTRKPHNYPPERQYSRPLSRPMHGPIRHQSHSRFVPPRSGWSHTQSQHRIPHTRV